MLFPRFVSVLFLAMSSAFASASVIANTTELKYVDINGARLAYRYGGAPDGLLIITLHGGRGFGMTESVPFLRVFQSFTSDIVCDRISLR